MGIICAVELKECHGLVLLCCTLYRCDLAAEGLDQSTARTLWVYGMGYNRYIVHQQSRRQKYTSRWSRISNNLTLL